MTTINTTLNSYATRPDGTLRLEPNALFAHVAPLALLIGMAHRDTHQIPTDLAGLQDLEMMQGLILDDCLEGLQGIGALLGAAERESLSDSDMEAVGRLISNIAALGLRAKEWRRQIALDPRYMFLQV